VSWHDPAVDQTVAAVIARMESILEPLPADDGVACFTRLYLAVTRGVQAQLARVTFADPEFLTKLDVRFAELFFAAVDASETAGGEIPHAWKPLFAARSHKGIAPLQFALAGMNAHINRDLPLAVVESCLGRHIELDDDSPQHADYLSVNALLASVEAEQRERYLSGWLRRLDRLLHRVHRIDDVLAMWNVERARDAAWTNAQALWAIRDDRGLSASYLSALDRTVGFAGRGLLRPAETWLVRAGRTLGLD
jgi:hypothetical protein